VLSCLSPLFSVIGFAADDLGDPWDGSSRQTPTLSADGFYEIDTAPKLAWYAYEITTNNNRTIKGRLTANINLDNKVWEPIGNNNRQYAGTFDGQDFKISNINITTTGVDRGFFGKITTSAVIRNLRLSGVTITGNREYSGGLVGVAVGGTFSNVHIEGININSPHNKVGGLIGQIENTPTISDCSVTGTSAMKTITGNQYVGGLVGFIKDNGPTFVNCKTENLDITASHNDSRAAGMIAYTDGRFTMYDSLVKDCYINAGRYIGGLAFVVRNGTIIERSGVVGTEIVSRNTSSTNDAEIGGFIGVVISDTINRIQYCYAADTKITAYSRVVGGFIGKTESARHIITECYSDVDFNLQGNPTRAGTFMGLAGSGELTNLYYVLNPSRAAIGETNSGALVSLMQVTDEQASNGALLAMLNSKTDVWKASEGSYPEIDPEKAVAPAQDENGYFLITSAYQLEWFEKYVNAGNPSASAKLLNDIYLSGKSFEPIGSNSIRFAGIFEGNNFTIHDLNINKTGNDRGLFGSTTVTSVIRNFKLKNASLTTNGSYVGVIAGLSRGLISNIEVEGLSVSGSSYVGGIAGQTENNASVTNVTITGTDALKSVYGSGSYVGGVVGNIKTSASDVANISVSGMTIRANSERAGGIAGDLDGGTATIKDVTITNNAISSVRYGGGIVFGLRNASSVTNTTVSNTTVSGAEELGGIAGCTSGSAVSVSNATVDNVTIASTSERIGGIIGYINSRANVTDSILKNSSITGTRYMGGVSYTLKDGSSIIKTGVVNTTITATNTSATSENHVAGLIGLVGWSTINTIQYSYVQNVTISSPGRTTGGFIGKIDTSAHNILENYANVVSINNNSTIYTGSYVGRRDTGNFVNNFAVAASGKPIVGNSTVGVEGNTAGITTVTLAQINNGEVCDLLNNVTEVWRQANDDLVNGWPEIGNADPPQLVNGYYEINTPYELEWFKNFVNAGNPSANARLMADINLRNKLWVPIGPDGGGSTRYSGTFDGNNFTISNLRVNMTSNDAGLFGTTTVQSVIKNLTIKTASVTSTAENTGVVVGVSRGVISNVHVEGLTVSGGTYVGGIAGRWLDNSNASVTDSTVTGNANGSSITASGNFAGGITSNVSSGTLTMTNVSVTDMTITASQRAGGLTADTDSGKLILSDSSASGNTVTATRYAGGIAFGLRNGSTATNVTVSNSTVTTTAVGGTSEVGGFVGNTSGSTVTVSKVTVDNLTVTANGEKAGGLIGYINGRTDITDSIVKNSSVTAQRHLGGIGYSLTGGSIITKVGILDTTLTATNTDASSEHCVGGLIGLSGWNTANTVQYCYVNNVTITAPGRAVGGFIGKIDTSAHNVSENYANVVSINNNAIYTGSFVGYRLTGNFINNFVVPASGKPLSGAATLGQEGNTAGITAVTADDVKNGNLTEMLNNVTDIWAQHANDLTNGWPEIGNAEPPQLVDGYYQIETSFQLEWFGNLVNNGTTGANAKLMKDINLRNKPWNPIGTDSRRYAGIFDGQGYTIRNVNITTTAVGDRGFFGKTNTTASLRNINIENLTLSNSRDYNGGLVGYLVGGSVVNCHIKGINITAGLNQTGGLIGEIDGNVTVSDCSVTGTEGMNAVVGAQNVGGLVGYVKDAGTTFQNCHVKNVSVTATNNDSRAAGLIGYTNGRTNIYDSTVTDSTINGGRMLAGLAFVIRGGSIVERSGIVNTQVLSTHTNANSDGEIGGFIGVLPDSTASRIQYCYSIGTRVVSYSRMSGGFIGKSESSRHLITESYSDANFDLQGTPTRAGVVIGYVGAGELSNIFYVPGAGKNATGEASSSASVDLIEIAQEDITSGSLLSQLNGITPLWIASEGGYPIPDATQVSAPAQDENGYYLLYSSYHLEWFMRYVNAGNTSASAMLMDNINLNGKSLDPIGPNNNRYAGTFDGNNFAILNLKINRTGNDIGLFGTTTTQSVIKNLTIKNAVVSSTANNVGAVVGVNRGVIANVHVEGLSISGGSNVAGIAGLSIDNNNASITDSSVTGTESGKTITASGTFAGGITGNVESGTVTITNANVTGMTITANLRAGGILSDTENGKVILSDSSASGNTIAATRYAGGGAFALRNGSTATNISVSDSTVTATTVGGTSEVGGFAGNTTGSTVTVSNITVDNLTVVANGEKAGGLIGYINNRTDITDSIVKNSSVTAQRHIGGIGYTLKDGSVITRVGVVDTTITATSTDINSEHCVGGLFGVVGWNTANTIQYSYVNGVSISSPGRMTGGFIGKIDTAAHNLSLNYVNNVSVSSSAIYVGSFVGYRTSGNFSNSFAANVSNKPLVGSNVADQAGNTAGISLVSVYDGDITSLPTADLLAYYVGDAAFIKSFENENTTSLKPLFGELYDTVQIFLAAVYDELALRLEAEIDVLRGIYNEYGMICIFNYESIGAWLPTVTTAIATSIPLSGTTADKYAFYLQLVDDFNTYMANYGYNSFYEVTVGFTTRVVRDDDIARYESPRDDFAVTYDKMRNVVDKVDSMLLGEDFALLTGMEISLRDTVKEKLSESVYTGEIINSVVEAIYPMIVEELESGVESAEIDLGVTTITFRGKARSAIEDLMRKFGLAIYPSELAARIDPKYTSVRDVLNAAGKNWSAVNFEDPDAPNYLNWGEGMDKEAFVDAFGNSLRGIYKVIRPMLTTYNFNERQSSGVIANIDVAARIEIAAADAYNSAIVPLFEMLNVKGFTSATVFNEFNNVDDMMDSILLPVFTWLEDELLSKPFSNLVELLPNIAYCLQFGLVEQWIKTLKTNVRADIDGVFDYWLGDIDFNITEENIAINLYDMLSEEEGDILYNADLSSINGLMQILLDQLDVQAELPSLNNKNLASLGDVVQMDSATRSLTRYYISGDSVKVTYILLNYIFNILGNEEFVTDLLGAFEDDEEPTEPENPTEPEEPAEIDESILAIIRAIASSPEDAIAAIVELCNPVDYSMRTLDYGNPLEAGYAKVQYSQYWTRDQAKYISDNLDDYIDNILKLLGLPTAGDFLRQKLGELYTNETLTTAIITIRDALTGIGSADKILPILDIDISSWEGIEEGHDWGITDGDKDSFLNVLCDALSPLNNAVGLFLADMDYTIMDGQITANGYNGYRYALVPILEALGCDYDTILTGDEYLAAVAEDPNSMIKHIVNPIFALLERVYEKPTETLFSILPNLIYFVNSGALDTALLNFAQPILVLLDTVRPIYSLEFELDVKAMIGEAITEAVEGSGFTLPDAGLENLGAYAVAQNNVHGEPIYVVDAGNEDVVTMLLRYLINFVVHPDNQAEIKTMLIEEAGLEGNQQKVLETVLDTFAAMAQQGNGADSVLNGVYYIFYGTGIGGGHANDFLNDFNTNWRKVFDLLANSNNELLRNLGQTAKDILNTYLGDILDEGGLAPNGFVKFLNAIADFFKKIADFFSSLFGG
jgi:hypothetical protein